MLFAPDIFVIGYERNISVGALLYNVGHRYVSPGLVRLDGWSRHHDLARAIGIIWPGHGGWDRFLGYGPTYDRSFTHAPRQINQRASPPRILVAMRTPRR